MLQRNIKGGRRRMGAAVYGKRNQDGASQAGRAAVSVAAGAG